MTAEIDFEQFIRTCERTVPGLSVTDAMSLFATFAGKAIAGHPLPDAVDKELRAGRRIQAIKAYRTDSDVSLKDAVYKIDALIAENPAYSKSNWS